MWRSSISVAAICAAVLSLTAMTATRADAQWGTLKGKFVYDGKAPTPEKPDVSKQQECLKHGIVYEELVVGDDGGLANVVIYVSSKGVKVHPDYEQTAKDTVRFDNKHCRFTPHVLSVRVSQTLELHNSDTFSHNTNIQPIGDSGENPVLGADSKFDFTFHKPQKIPVKVVCNIHPWMTGWVVVREDPYVGVSQEDGTFEIEKLPAGELEFTLWHEKVGWLKVGTADTKGKFKMKIENGDNDLGEIKVNSKALEKKKSGAA